MSAGLVTQSVLPVVQHATDHGAILLPYSMSGAQGARYGDPSACDPSVCDPSIWKAEEKHCEFVVSLDYIAGPCFKEGQRRGLCNFSIPLSPTFSNNRSADLSPQETYLEIREYFLCYSFRYI